MIGDLEGDEQVGARVVQRSLRAPLHWIAENTGRNGSVVVEEVLERKSPVGFDAVNGEFTDLWKAGIVDPAKVTRTALQNAVSVATILLSTNCLVTDAPKKKDGDDDGGGEGMDGMDDM